MKTKKEIVNNWLPRYTGEKLENFGEYILLTNFSNYVKMFADINNVKIVGIDKAMECATADNITIINFGMGSQNIIQFLIIKMQYPASLIAIEKEIKLGELRKRCDVVIYDRQSEPWMIIECKEMNVPLSEKTLAQILRYHIALPAKYLIITNGSYSFGFEKKDGQFFETDKFPEFEI
jgi:hypothetical protein